MLKITGFLPFCTPWLHDEAMGRWSSGSMVLWGIPHFARSRSGGTLPVGRKSQMECMRHSRPAYRDTSYGGGGHATPAPRAARSTLMRADVMAAVATHRTTSECDLLRGTAPQCVARQCMARKKHQCHVWRRNWRSYLGHLDMDLDQSLIFAL